MGQVFNCHEVCYALNCTNCNENFRRISAGIYNLSTYNASVLKVGRAYLAMCTYSADVAAPVTECFRILVGFCCCMPCSDLNVTSGKKYTWSFFVGAEP
jgi:hypothetical protein